MPKCGNCGKADATVAEIRACYGRGITLGAQQSSAEDYFAEEAQRVKPEITDGFWKLDGTIYKVQEGRESGKLYGKRLVVSMSGDPGDPDVDAGFEYEPNVPGKLANGYATKLTLEEAKEFGALYGVCCICGRTLTNEVSIEAGIGPICAGRLE